jgi:UDP-N-acetylglucosamine 2-epimerase (non-hydrolysing)
VLAGTVRLVGTNTETIINNTFELLDDNIAYNKMAKSYNPYGDGKANDRIINYIKLLNI